MKIQINILEKAFRGSVNTAINRELNRIRRNGMMGEHLLRALTDIYHQHNMRGWSGRRRLNAEEQSIPKIVYSEGLGR